MAYTMMVWCNVTHLQLSVKGLDVSRDVFSQTNDVLGALFYSLVPWSPICGRTDTNTVNIRDTWGVCWYVVERVGIYSRICKHIHVSGSILQLWGGRPFSASNENARNQAHWPEFNINRSTMYYISRLHQSVINILWYLFIVIVYQPEYIV